MNIFKFQNYLLLFTFTVLSIFAVSSVYALDTTAPVITVNPATITLEAGLTVPNFLEGVSTDDGTENGFIATWSGRQLYQVVLFNNELWLLGGFDETYKNDIWKSTDGATWTQVDANGSSVDGLNAPWSGRSSHQVVLFNNELWLFGGFDGSTVKNDIWKSTDGIAWTQVDSNGSSDAGDLNAPWSARSAHQIVLFNNVLWFLGGYDGSVVKNDVWKSTDGITWTEVDANGDDSGSNAPWSTRFGHQVVIFNNDLWLLGGWDGVYKNDLWKSTDGTIWTQVDSNGSSDAEDLNAPWSGRDGHKVVLFDNALWLLGGYDGTVRENDIWKSTDGATWTQVDSNGSSDVGDLNAPWSRRDNFQAIPFNNALWLLGGFDSTVRKNDIWKSLDGSIWTGGDASVVTTSGMFNINTVGTYTITYSSTDASENVAVSKTREYIVQDTTKPDAPSISLKESSNSGTNIDRTTNDNTPDITISNAETDSTINITATKQGETSIIGSRTGNGDITLQTLVDGEWFITAIATDGSGNVSIVSNTLVITIDTILPTITVTPTTITLEAGSTLPNFFDGVSTDDRLENGFIAPWSGRYSHKAVSFNNALWLLGGTDGQKKNDIWKSTDGTTWTQVDANGDDFGLNAPWSARNSHQVVSFNNALWLLGGTDGSNKNDIWKSADGISWTQVDSNGSSDAGDLNAPWSGRSEHQVVSFNGTLWLLGGYDGARKNDIWKSTNGTTWTEVDINAAGLNAPWSARNNYQVVSFKGAIWLLGGYDGTYKNDIWKSMDGETWAQVDANGSLSGLNAPWSARHSHQVVSYNNTLWLLGGNHLGILKNDIWKSTDGTTWTHVDANGSETGLNAPWSARSGHQVVSFNNTLWLLGGEGGSQKNDVWKSFDGSIWTSGNASVITTDGTVDINTAGTYVITYSSTDASGNVGLDKTRTYTVVAAKQPVITVTPETITLEAGSTLPNFFEGVSTDDGSENGFIAPWSRRSNHQVVSFNNAFWLLGGNDSSNKNDIWKSLDGTSWTQVDSNGSSDTGDLNAPWSARNFHQVVSFDSALWLLGGNDGSYKNDIWKSTDGTSWTQVDANGSANGSNAPWSGRSGHRVVSFNGALWLLGGFDGSNKNDIWKSTDGTSWTQVDANGSANGSNAPWSERRLHQVVSFNNALWLFGGTDGSNKNDIWKSADGISWTQVDSNGSSDTGDLNAPWSARNSHQVVLFDNAMWLLGGFDDSYKNDIWKSTDGTTWTQVDANGDDSGSNAPWSERDFHQVVSFNNAIWLLGGADGSYKNDIWKSLDGSNWTGGDASIITASGTVNINTVGTYTITYSSTDVEGNAAVNKTRTYTVIEGELEQPDAPSISISPASVTVITGAPIAPITINSSGGDVVSYSINPAIGNGLLFNTTTGTISGTPTAAASITTYTITATNTAGTDTATIAITVNVLNINAPTITVNPATTILKVGSTLPNFFEGVSTNDGSENGFIAPWSTRIAHQAVSFNGALWLLGGHDGSAKNDIWKSMDGTTWTQVDSNGSSDAGDLNAPWSARFRYQIVSHNNALWLLGGQSDVRKNDVWKSTDGVSWTQVDANGPNSAGLNAPWSARRSHQAVSFNGALWVLGGFDGANKNDVWKSMDGTTWTQVDSNGSSDAGDLNAPWSARRNHQAVLFNNAMWLLGGRDTSTKNDVWKSTDGTTWTQVNANAPWSAREDYQVASFNNTIWLLGGSSGSLKNDVWKSTDGTTWTQVNANAPWSARDEFQVAPHNNALWLLGGSDGSNKNDVWKSLDGSIWTGGDASIITTSGTVDVNTLGTYTITYSSTDAEGNAAINKTRAYTVIALNAPIITTNTQSINNSAFTLKGTAEANSTITLTQNGNVLSQVQSTSSAGEWSFPVTLISGENTFTVTATNSLNNISAPSSQSIITLEFLPPEFNIIPFVNNSNYTVRGFVLDENATITLTQNGNVLSAAIEPTSTRTIPGRVRNGVVTNSVVRKVRPYWSYDVTLIDGINTFVATATSAEGIAVSSSTAVTLDTVAPIITLANPIIELEAGLSTIPEELSASIGVSTDDGSRITISGYGDVFRNKGNPGDYNVIYNSRDDAGNAATPITRIYRIIDTTSPVITLQKEISIAQGSSYIDGGVTLVDNDVTYAAGIRRKDSNGFSVCPFTQTTNCYTQNPATFSSTGTVDTSTLGTYTITYSAPNDNSDNSVNSVTRTVYVIPATTPTSIAEKSIVLNGITKTITVKTDISVPSNQINAFKVESYTDAETIALIYDKTNVETRDENEILIPLKSNESIRTLEDFATYIKVNHDACSENNNCEVVLQYTSSNLKSLGNIKPSSLTIFHFNSENNKWEELKNIVVDISEKTITGSIGTFSPFIIGTINTKSRGGTGFIPRQRISSVPFSAPSIKTKAIYSGVPVTIPSITTLPTITNFVTNFGQNGNDVISLQQTLNLTACKVSATAHGSKGLETNYFGNKTRNAIKCLQQQYQLPITGTISLETQTILQIIKKIEEIKTLIQIKLQQIQG